MARQSYDAEQDFKARRALTSIHDAREQADAAMDQLIEAHSAAAADDALGDAHTDLHVAVIRLYNRLRPYLSEVPHLQHERALLYERDESGEIKTTVVETADGREERPLGIFGLSSLDRWRLATTVVEDREERAGKPDERVERERPLRMPLELAVAAYDALEEAIVDLGFSAEANAGVPSTHLDDAPDEIDASAPEAVADGGTSDE